MRVVKMSVLTGGKSVLRDVILPPIGMILSQDKDTGEVPTHSIRYFVASNATAFPIAHIFSQSGAVCYGSIFIPKTVSIHQAVLPLDTLLLYNDRYLAHGNPVLTVNSAKLDKINQCLTENQLAIFTPTYQNLAEDDALWRLSADVLEQVDSLLRAYQIMQQIFEIVFPSRT